MESVLINQQKKTDKAQELFLNRFLGDSYFLLNDYHTSISRDIVMRYFDLKILPLTDYIEEKAILNFDPYDDGKYYLQITYFPEYNNSFEGKYHVIRLIYQPDFFIQWPESLLNSRQPFLFDRCSEQGFSLNAASRESFDYLLHHSGNSKDFLFSLQRQQAAISLLQFALHSFLGPNDAGHLPACSFLDDNSERNQILKVEQIILNNLDKPLSLKELSREVGMNECYLKKGFKAIFGKTILEYQQQKRVEKAKKLIQNGELTINEVAFMMGYSSPSYFSTIFKKITGMKPCELLG